MEYQTSLIQRYMKLIVMTIILALVMVGLWQYQQHQKNKQIELASQHYETLLQLMRQKDYKAAKEEAETLIQLYPKTPYAPLSALMLARVALEQNNYEKAAEQFRFALEKAKGSPIEHVAKTRLARVLMNEEKYEEALAVLEKPSEGYVTLYEEIKGDIYHKQNNLSKAKEAYAAALKAAPQGVPTNALQLKYNDLNDSSHESNQESSDVQNKEKT